jgi:hypothetical protein
MKDYSELKGLKVKYINHFQGLKYKGCYVAEIDDCGLTILGYCMNHKDDPPPDVLVKVFCLKNYYMEHLNLFPVTVKMILTGVIDDRKINNPQKFRWSQNSQPICAFE